MARGRSLRPKKPSAVHQVESLYRQLGRAEPGLLEAALEGVDAKRALARALAEPTAQLVEQAYAVCLEAHAAFQRYSSSQRAHLRGFSLQLLALATEQALLLERTHAEHERKQREQEEAKARLRELFERNVKLAAQARMVLEKVSGDDPAVQKGLAEGSSPDTSYALSDSLKRLADLGDRLVRSNVSAVRGRARLYGLDENFLSGIAVAGAELIAMEQKAGDQSALTTRKNQLDRAQAATYVLMRQIGEAFEAASGVDPQISPLVAAQPKVDPEATRAAKRASAKGAPTVTIISGPAPAPAAPKVVGPAPALRVIDPSELGSGKTMRS
jgi:hypothetical protein